MPPKKFREIAKCFLYYFTPAAVTATATAALFPVTTIPAGVNTPFVSSVKIDSGALSFAV